jgi:hypothetical protein
MSSRRGYELLSLARYMPWITRQTAAIKGNLAGLADVSEMTEPPRQVRARAQEAFLPDRGMKSSCIGREEPHECIEMSRMRWMRMGARCPTVPRCRHWSSAMPINPRARTGCRLVSLRQWLCGAYRSGRDRRSRCARRASRQGTRGMTATVCITPHSYGKVRPRRTIKPPKYAVIHRCLMTAAEGPESPRRDNSGGTP